MRIVFFGNNRVAVDVLSYLMTTDDRIVGLVVHPETKSRMAGELIGISRLKRKNIFLGNKLGEKATIRGISELNPDVGVSVYFGYIIGREVLATFRKGCLNLHPSLLPFNKGAYPNVWSIVDGTPAGATLHVIDEGVDTGDILAQVELPVLPWDSGKTLYRKLEKACLRLFKKEWPDFVAGRILPKKQMSAGTMHKVRDVDGIDEIDLERDYKARKLIDILRARTFPPHKGAYFMWNGRRVYLTVRFEPEEEIIRDNQNERKNRAGNSNRQPENRQAASRVHRR